MKELKNSKDGKRLPALHGECFLKPVDKIPEGTVEHTKEYIVGHSETGHHHVLVSDEPFEVMSADDKHDLYVRLFAPAKLVHQKSFDIHETQTIVEGDYAIYHKSEFDPFHDVVRAVFD